MRLTRILLLAALAVAGLSVVCWQLAKSRTWQAFGDLTYKVQTDRRVVALTFDDGPAPGAVAELLPVLEGYGVRATFFLTGSEIERPPESATAAGTGCGGDGGAKALMLARLLKRF